MRRCPSLRVTRELQYWPMQYRAQMAIATPTLVKAIPPQPIQVSAGTKRNRSGPIASERENRSSKPSTMGRIVVRRGAKVSVAFVRFTCSQAISQYAAKTYQGIKSICHRVGIFISSSGTVPLAVSRSRLLDGRVRWCENAGRTVFPYPGVDHPLRFRGEVSALGGAIAFVQMGANAPIGEHAEILM